MMYKVARSFNDLNHPFYNDNPAWSCDDKAPVGAQLFPTCVTQPVPCRLLIYFNSGKNSATTCVWLNVPQF